ncbi:ABC transporter substrate-binding protein [Metabacillus arenae]|uniref:Extracellular solute-binding protein n=1 Tax=Metabacillus arenae TaxID=2771434 RepID=A0A926RZI0_9BACI|nr:extracellular solute-binding protein [Metabacillus arenae]MBD1382277.1 extracellular solute-binding protein [Metabacillus arenae]
MKALKRTSIIFLISVLMIVTSGCMPTMNQSDDGAANPSDPNQTDNVVVKLGTWPIPDSKNLAQYEEWKKQFENEHPNIKIEPDSYPYDTNTFLPKAESGQLPTIYETWFTEPIKIIGGDYAADITDLMEEYGWDKAINPDMLSLIKQDGKIYGIPTSGYYMGIWYNMNLFKQAGLLDENGVPKFPQTYEELAEAAKTIKEKTGKAGFFFPTKNNQGGWQFMNIAWSYGAEFERVEDGKWKAVFNSPEAVEALQFVKDLKWEHDVLQDNILAEVDDMFQFFGTDQVGMAFGTTDWMQSPIDRFKMNKDNLANSSVPAGPKDRVALTGGELVMFAPNSTEEQKKAGFEWQEHTGFSSNPSEESLKGLEETLKNYKELGHIVGPHGMRVWVNPERVKAEDAVREKYSNVNMDLFTNYTDNKGVTFKPEVPVNAQELYKVLDGVIQEVLTNKNADPKKLLDKAAADFQRDYLDKAEVLEGQ